MPCPFSYFCSAKKELEMKVICLGAPHAGNETLGRALQAIYLNPIYDVSNSLSNSCQMCRWKKLLKKKFNPNAKKEDQIISLDDFKGIFEGYCGISMSPHIFFVEDIVKAYPNAKFIVTKIETDEWIKKAREVTFAKQLWEDQGLVVRFARYLSGINKRLEFIQEFIQKTYGIKHLEKDEELLKLYNAHYENVDKFLPKEKRLDFNEKDGWKPLCDFLQVPIPDKTYPEAKKCPLVEHDGRFCSIVKYGIPITLVAAVAISVGLIIKKTT